ncbi:MAG: hypothetical protein AAF821_18215 [Cyanobacteria bacterium P01_D01_bin.156]
MDTEYTYPIGSNGDIPYRVVIGWSDTEQSYFSRVETDTLEPRTVWQFEPAVTSMTPLLDVLALTQIEARKCTSIEQFELPEDDINALIEATRQRLVDPSEIQPLNMLDTDYAKAPIYGNTPSPALVHQQLPFEQFLAIIDDGRSTSQFSNDAPYDDLEQMVADSLFELQTCVSYLSTSLTNEQRCHLGLVFTACQLIQINQSLNLSFSHDRMHHIAIESESPIATLHNLFTPDEIDRINALTVSLCGSKLTDFRQALERGYDPTNGAPLDCPNPVSFNWADTVEDDAIGLYQQYGLSLDDAQHMVDIERTDPRYRAPEDWAFLESTAQRLRAISERRREGME